MRRYFVGLGVGLLILSSAYLLVMSYYYPLNPEIQFLPYYTFRTVLRITVTLLLSIGTGLAFGILAATNRYANATIVPFFDVLQSIPILGYFPAVIMFFISAFPPPSELGIELSAILLLYTSMMWAIFFGVFGAVKTLPVNILEASQAFGLRGFNYIRHIILPAIIPALISGSTLAWCDGWFFMIVAEYITYGGQTYSLPGLGSFLARAAWIYNDMGLAVILLILITLLVLFLNFLTWHRLTERIHSGIFKPLIKNGFLNFFKPKWISHLRFQSSFRFHGAVLATTSRKKYKIMEWAIALILIIFTVIGLTYLLSPKIPSLDTIIQDLSDPETKNLPMYTAYTMTRLTIAYLISLAVAITMGVLAAEHKKFATIFYPIYDIGQAVPILSLFPILFMATSKYFGARMGLEVTCIVMLVLDMIWYMFLNIMNAVRAIPDDVREVARLFGFKGIKRVTHIVIPSILPAIVTGSMLSWATGWNTVIFSEYMPYGREVLMLPGLGSFLDKVAYEYGNTTLLMLILALITSIVILMEKFVWRALLKKFERYRVEV